MFEIMYRHIIYVIEENTDISRESIIYCLEELLEKGYGEVESGRIIILTWNDIKGGKNGSKKKCSM